MRIGYKLATEGFPPAEIVDQARKAEDAGFDFVEMSDHYHPWLEAQGHSMATWPLLGYLASATSRVGLVTGVTCPHMRYHPAVIAQQAATVQILSDGRFELGVGAGERLNEHVVGDFPSATVRHERFREALEIIRLLWQGGYQSYHGKHLTLEDARVFDLPDRLPEVLVAISGKQSARIAADLGDGIFATDPERSLVEAFHGAGGSGSLYAECGLGYAATEQEAVEAVQEKNAWLLSGWKVMAELPNPVNFQSVNDLATPEAITQKFPCGPDLEKHVEAVRAYTDAGFENVVLMNTGPDPDAFFGFFTRELEPELRTL